MYEQHLCEAIKQIAEAVEIIKKKTGWKLSVGANCTTIIYCPWCGAKLD